LFQSLRIRSKLAFALLIPLLALVLSSSLVIAAANRRASDAQAEADAVSEQVALATAALGPSGILRALNDERTAEAIALIGLDPKVLGGTATRAETRQVTDRAIEQFRAAIAQKPKAVRDTYQSAIDGLPKVREIRARSDASTELAMGNPDASGAYDEYSKMIISLFDGNTSAALAVDNAELRSGVRFIDQLARYNDTTSVVQRSIGGAISFKGVKSLYEDPASLAEAAGLNRVGLQQGSDLPKNDNPFYAGLARTLLASPGLVGTQKLRDDAVAGLPVSISDMLGQNASDAVTVTLDTQRQAADHLQADADRIRSGAQAEADEAASQARLVTEVTAAALVLAVAVTMVASRSITRPLSRLVRAAEDMATVKLPKAVKEILDTPPGEDVEVPLLTKIDDRGGYEIAEVASALNTVQTSATDLAVEQAVLRRNIADAFVNLGRRNQNLLTRLLEAITEMERNEPDPDQLQQLFTLDHVATRMRRNAESLVVLAGVETRRQWSDPIAIVDLIRGALGEVEDFQRAEIVELDDALVSGSAVADVTHLVAELLENALTHSPPHRPVEIRGRAHHGGYRLLIVDHGVGMEPDELTVANTRLSGGESFTVAPSRYLGHYVVGRQASRMGLDVVLMDTPGGGITAVIEIGAVVGTAPAAAPAAEPRPSLDGRFAHRSLATASSAITTSSPPAAIEAPAVAAPAAEVDPAVAEGPPTLAEALSTDTGDVSADDARTGQPATVASAPVASAAVAPATTGSGYVRRVRGANALNTEVRAARTEPSARKKATGADAMRSALNSMQAGMQRSQSEPDVAGETDSEER
jgi:HAMP domain-containing protein